MTKCKICEQQFKRLTPSHIKTHGLTMIEYYEKYDQEKHREKLITNFLNEYYVGIRYRYIKYISNEIIQTVDVRAKKQIPLNDTNLKAHVQGDYTIGVYFPEKHTKFIGLDLDVPDIEKLESIFNALWSYGIPRESIFMSYSGNKGYHIDIFLNKMIKKTVVYRFYEMLLNELDLSEKELEVRGAGAQGYKLPLGTHVKTGKYCFACDEYGNQIDELQVIKGIEKADIGIIFNALNMNYEATKSDKQIIEYEEMTKSVPYTTQYENKGRRKKVEKVLYSGLRDTGDRNNTCFEVAMYCKDIENLCLADTIHRIETWIRETWKTGAKPEEFISSGEVEKISKKVYEHNYKFNSKYDDLLRFTDVEIAEVFTVTNSHGGKQGGLRKLYHAMIIHAKGYAGKDGLFYMTYDQIRNLGLKNMNKHIKQQIDELIKLGKVERFEPGEERMKNGKTPPYKYRLPRFEEVRGQGNKYFTCENTSRCKDCIYITYGCLIQGQELPPNSSCHGKLIVL